MSADPVSRNLRPLLRAEGVRCRLDRPDERRDVLELVQHHAPCAQRTHEAMRVAFHRGACGFIVQRDVLQAPVGGDGPRQRRLAGLPGPGDVDHAELVQHGHDEGLQATNVHGGSAAALRRATKRHLGCLVREIQGISAINTGS